MKLYKTSTLVFYKKYFKDSTTKFVRLCPSTLRQVFFFILVETMFILFINFVKTQKYDFRWGLWFVSIRFA